MLARTFTAVQFKPMGASLFSVIEVWSDGRSPSFVRDSGETPPSSTEIEEALSDAPSTQGFVVLPQDVLPGWTARGRTFLIRAACLREDWRAAGARSDAADKPSAILVRFDALAFVAAFQPVANAFGLTAMESDLACGLAMSGSFEREAHNLGLARTPARNALARLRRKFGTRNVAETIIQSLALVAREPGRSGETLDNLIANALDLDRRRFALVRAMADGTQRKVAAAKDGRSLSAIKADLAYFFVDHGLTSAAELACLVGQAQLVGEHFLLTEDGNQSALEGGAERLLDAGDGRRVAYAIYGQGNGPVAAILHSTITCRHPPMRFVRKMIRRGWQVLAIDRPGFGGTDEAHRADIDIHTACAAADLAAICEQEGFAQLTLVARGSGQMAIALANLLGPLIERAILVNPTPPISHTPVDRGPLGAVKRRFAKHPASIRTLIEVVLRITTLERMTSTMRRTFASSPPDLVVLDDPQFASDYHAAATALRTNLSGYVLENAEWAQGWEPRPKVPATDWKILLGGHFVLHDTATVRGYFSRLLPQASIRVVRDAGQMLMYSHPEEVMRELIDV